LSSIVFSDTLAALDELNAAHQAESNVKSLWVNFSKLCATF